MIVENFQVLSVPEEHKHVTFSRKKNEHVHHHNFAENDKNPQIKIDRAPQAEISVNCKALANLEEKTFPYKVKPTDTLFSISLKFGVR